MDYLRFIFYLGVIYITFDLLWKLFLWLIKMFFGITSKDSAFYHLFKALSYYLLVSLTAATTLRYMAGTEEMVKQFFFTFVGLIVLYFYITSNMQKSRLRAAIRSDVIAIRRMRFNSLYLLFSVSFYIFCLYFPRTVETLVLDWLFSTVERIFNYLLFRWIIGFMASLFLINMLYRGLLTTKVLIMSIFGIREKSTSSYRDMYGRATPYEETIDAEYQVVPDEEIEEEEKRELGTGK